MFTMIFDYFVAVVITILDDQVVRFSH